MAQERALSLFSSGFIGEHPSIIKLRTLIERVALTDVTVLITGLSGSGKEVVAQAIHAISARRDQPFVPVNCAAIPRDLLECEMFGHRRGAYTGADASRPGLFTSAHGGTIFLDEVGEMNKELQVKLLRVLEDRMVRPVGSDLSSRVNVRVIAASNLDLAHAVECGQFREDLFYRLRVVPIMIPSLCDRRSDIRLLVEHFLEIIRLRSPERAMTVSLDAMAALCSYQWPGNVRELANLLEGLSVVCEGSEMDTPILPDYVFAARPAPSPPQVCLNSHGIKLNDLILEWEHRLINDALEQTDGNKGAAARLLGLNRTTLSVKLKRCDVNVTASHDNDCPNPTMEQHRRTKKDHLS